MNPTRTIFGVSFIDPPEFQQICLIGILGMNGDVWIALERF